ncbi:MAG: tetratricopeptide repeat protein, partial [Gemmatimonadetes bacterium]|nr:tetratricopeptide repeat protein [Gemmatimonadota bacterium]
RFALREATAHLREGLHSISERPAGPERDRDGLELRTLLSPAMVAVHGWAAPEVSEVMEPALELARSLDHREAYLPLLNGLWVHFMSAGRHETAMGWAEETLSIASTIEDEDLTICGHRSAMTSNFWMGNIRASQDHGDRLRELYHPERHAHIASLTNNDPLTADGSYRAQYLWMLGYPDQAAALSDAKDEHARRGGHPFDLCFALTVGAQAFDYRREPEALLERVDEAIRVGREHRIPLMSEVMAQLVRGAAWLRAGRPAEARELLSATLTELGKTGHRAWVPYVRVNLAEAVALTGDFDGGLALVEESLEQMESQGERVHYAEALRRKGWMLIQKGDLDGAGRTLDEAVRFARDQGTRSWELRASTTRARLLAERGDPAAARELLAPIYDWFTEGLDTPDLVDARVLLAELA